MSAWPSFLMYRALYLEIKNIEYTINTDEMVRKWEVGMMKNYKKYIYSIHIIYLII